MTIIDLKDMFKSLAEKNSKIKNKEIEEEYIEKYIDLRKKLSGNKFCPLINFRYGLMDSDIDFSHIENWNSIQMLGGEIYDNHPDLDRLLDIKSYIVKICNSIDSAPEEVNDYLLGFIDEEYGVYFNLLLIIEDSMIKIAEFREKYVEEVNDSKYVFASYLDFLTTGDYLRLSLIEDFVLDQGAFAELKDDLLLNF